MCLALGGQAGSHTTPPFHIHGSLKKSQKHKVFKIGCGEETPNGIVKYTWVCLWGHFWELLDHKDSDLMVD